MKIGKISLSIAIFSLATIAASQEAQRRTTDFSEQVSLEGRLEVSNWATGAICSGRWQGPNAGFLTSWFVGDESYAAYQNPLETGCVDAYPFSVTQLKWRVTNMTALLLTVPMRPLIYGVDPQSSSCPKPGGNIAFFPLANVQIPALSTVVVTLPLMPPVCVSGPYFAAVECPDILGQGKLGINLDSAQVVPLRECATYVEFLGFWQDAVADYDFPGNLTLWSEGFVADSNNCQTGGACCVGIRGNVDCDTGQIVDISDLTVLITHLFISFSPLCCMEEGNLDQANGVDISDLTLLIDHLFISNATLEGCP